MKHTPIIVGVFALLLFVTGCTKPTLQSSSTTSELTDPNQPPLLLKSIGFVLGTYDPATGMAGDFKFTKAKLQQDRIWMDFGYVIPAGNSATGADKPNPQPTFILPLGTKVRSLVDGIVVNVPILYSGDYSVQVGENMNSQWLYETEHVLNPLVKAGDRVTAGQVIAEVSTWSKDSNDGLGMFEIGILRGGNPPEHVCPFAYLDPSVKADLQAKITAFYKSWEEYRGDSTLYDETKTLMPGCLSDAAIPG